MVESDVGVMGGDLSIEFQAPCAAGEDTIAICEHVRLQGERAGGDAQVAAARLPGERLDAPKEVETPGVETIEDLAAFLKIDPRTTSKAFPVVADGQIVLALVRGDHRVNEFKLGQALQASGVPRRRTRSRRPSAPRAARWGRSARRSG